MAYGFNQQFSQALTNVVTDVDPANPVRIGHLHTFNPNGTPVYVQMFGKAASTVVLGTTPPAVVLSIGPNLPISPSFTSGWKFPGSALSMAVTSTPTGAGAPVTAPYVTVVYGGA